MSIQMIKLNKKYFKEEIDLVAVEANLQKFDKYKNLVECDNYFTEKAELFGMDPLDNTILDSIIYTVLVTPRIFLSLFYSQGDLYPIVIQRAYVLNPEDLLFFGYKDLRLVDVMDKEIIVKSNYRNYLRLMYLRLMESGTYSRFFGREKKVRFF